MANLIFISYRRSDIPIEQVNLIHEGLENVFGEGSVFLDTADIHGGAKWKKILNEAGTHAKVCLVLIGPRWMEKDDQGRIRIQQEGDWVRQEIEYAMEKNLVILPVLVNGGVLPQKEDLPDSLKSFNDSQGIVVRTAEWSTYKEKLIRDLKKNIKGTSKLKSLLWILLPAAAVVGGSFLLPNFIKRDNTQAPPCTSFATNAELKTLLFPVYARDRHSSQETIQLIDESFSTKCTKYGISFENQLANTRFDTIIVRSSKIQIAKTCGADLYFSGRWVGEPGQQGFEADFQLVRDTINAFVAAASDLSIKLTRFSVNELLGDEAVEEWYEKVIQFLVGLVAYQEGDFKQSVLALKEAVSDTLRQDSLKLLAYSIITDAYYQLKMPDSCLEYQQKLTRWSPTEQVVLKTAILAEQYNRPEVAIVSYTTLIDSGKYDKNVLLEKRADQYAEIKEYSKAKQDYQRVKTNENNKERVNAKIERTNTQIERNRAAVTSVNNLQATETVKIRAADLYLQNGQANKAAELLKSIPKNSEYFKQAEPLLQEAQLKINPSAVTVTEAAVKANQRLKTEAGLRNLAVKKND
ncbi:MAG TPA: toll/interleukin-1 receptor domain-containing protein [Saprospiraceae bacterium]|nr:toll/interleukin-1 receptor domain-containing protein [Saprospiraceae bacterium]HNT21087.1 toll/interleukin-1 receptor domain-containing protein [Saprospiraceae bacterium]